MIPTSCRQPFFKLLALEWLLSGMQGGRWGGGGYGMEVAETCEICLLDAPVHGGFGVVRLDVWMAAPVIASLAASP
jgi:hypothetical protein